MSTLKATNFQHPSAASPAIVLDAAGGATVAGMGLVLVKPTSIANTGGTASLSGGAVTLTGAVTSVSLNGVFTSAYVNYLMILTLTASAVVPLHFRMRLAGTDAVGANYNSQYMNADTAAVSAARTTAGTSARFGGVGTTRSAYQVNVYEPQLVSVTTVTSSGVFGASSALVVASEAGNHDLSTAYDGLTIFPNSSTMAGIIRVYGYQN